MECFQQVILKAATSCFVDATGKFRTVPVGVRTVPGGVRTVSGRYPDGSRRFWTVPDGSGRFLVWPVLAKS